MKRRKLTLIRIKSCHDSRQFVVEHIDNKISDVETVLDVRLVLFWHELRFIAKYAPVSRRIAVDSNAHRVVCGVVDCNSYAVEGRILCDAGSARGLKLVRRAELHAGIERTGRTVVTLNQ